MEKSIQEKLLEAIMSHGSLTEDEIKQAGEHGADGGFNGFIYYADSVRFYESNKSEIWALLEDERSNFGTGSVVELISNLRGSRDVETPETFANLLAWFTLETIGQWLTMRDETELCRIVPMPAEFTPVLIGGGR